MGFLQGFCEFFEIFAEIFAHFGVFEAHFHSSLQDSQLVAHIIPGAGVVHTDHAVPAGQDQQGVCELDLTAGAGLGVLQNGEDLRRYECAGAVLNIWNIMFCR